MNNVLLDFFERFWKNINNQINYKFTNGYLIDSKTTPTDLGISSSLRGFERLVESQLHEEVMQEDGQERLRKIIEKAKEKIQKRT